jgi:hypothetical protein
LTKALETARFALGEIGFFDNNNSKEVAVMNGKRVIIIDKGGKEVCLCPETVEIFREKADFFIKKMRKVIFPDTVENFFSSFFEEEISEMQILERLRLCAGDTCREILSENGFAYLIQIHFKNI